MPEMLRMMPGVQNHEGEISAADSVMELSSYLKLKTGLTMCRQYIWRQIRSEQTRWQDKSIGIKGGMFGGPAGSNREIAGLTRSPIRGSDVTTADNKPAADAGQATGRDLKEV
jgi:hypothetical protein